MIPITVSAPTRIADLGGWTDTWFAGHGVVCHIAVWPGVDVTISPCDGPAGVEVRVRNFDREWHWTAGTPAQVCPDPLIGACLDEGEVLEQAAQGHGRGADRRRQACSVQTRALPRQSRALEVEDAQEGRSFVGRGRRFRTTMLVKRLGHGP